MNCRDGWETRALLVDIHDVCIGMLNLKHETGDLAHIIGDKDETDSPAKQTHIGRHKREAINASIPRPPSSSGSSRSPHQTASNCCLWRTIPQPQTISVSVNVSSVPFRVSTPPKDPADLTARPGGGGLGGDVRCDVPGI